MCTYSQGDYQNKPDVPPNIFRLLEKPLHHIVLFMPASLFLTYNTQIRLHYIRYDSVVYYYTLLSDIIGAQHAAKSENKFFFFFFDVEEIKKLIFNIRFSLNFLRI